MSGSWGETVDIYARATALQREICVYAMLGEKWFHFTPCRVLRPLLTCDLSSVSTTYLHMVVLIGGWQNYQRQKREKQIYFEKNA